MRSDVYSLGATLWEVLTLRPMFDAPNKSSIELIQSIHFDRPAPVRSHNPAAPADLERVVARCLEKDPRQRYATARELADDLGRFLVGEPVHAKPVGTLEHLWRWCKRPERIRNAGVFNLFLTALGILWCLATVVALAANKIHIHVVRYGDAYGCWPDTLGPHHSCVWPGGPR